MSEAQRRIVDQKILDAELSGIGLTGEARERFNAIVQELSQLNTDFPITCSTRRKAFAIVVSHPAEVEGLPPSLLRLASQSYNGTLAEGTQPGTEEAGPWRFTLEFPSYGPFMQHSFARELREKMYRAYVTRASTGPLDNTPLIQKILSLRAEKARLLGFNTFAELSLAKKMAPSLASVEAMFETLRAPSRTAAEKELSTRFALWRPSRESAQAAHQLGYRLLVGAAAGEEIPIHRRGHCGPIFPLAVGPQGIIWPVRSVSLEFALRRRTARRPCGTRMFAFSISPTKPAGTSRRSTSILTVGLRISGAALGWMIVWAAAVFTMLCNCRSPISFAIRHLRPAASLR